MDIKKSLIGTAMAAVLMVASNANAFSGGNAAALAEIRITTAAVCQMSEVNTSETEIYVDAAANNILGLGIDVSGSYYDRDTKGVAIDRIMSEIQSTEFFQCNLQVFDTLANLLLVKETGPKGPRQSS